MKSYELDRLRIGMGLITLECKNNKEMQKEMLKLETFSFLLKIISGRIKNTFFQLCGIQCVTCLIMFALYDGDQQESLNTMKESNLINILSSALLEKTKLSVAHGSKR